MGAMRKCLLLLTIVLILLLNQKNVLGGEAMEISSSAFKDGEKIPIQYVMPGAGGKNISIPLAWKIVPAGTKSFCPCRDHRGPGRRRCRHCSRASMVLRDHPPCSSLAGRLRIPPGTHKEAGAKAEKAGLKVVMDRCMKKDHQRGSHQFVGLHPHGIGRGAAQRAFLARALYRRA